MSKQLLVNMIKCPDGTILESRYRWDKVSHTQKDGTLYSIDGGLSSNEVWTTGKDYENLSCYVGDPHTIIRDRFSWGSRGVDGTEPLHYILLKDITERHLENLIIYTEEVPHYPKYINDLFVTEKYYRSTL